ncbi:MAG: UDP-N-acetylmuramate--L-alanine ligase [Actinomycetota bacterium]|nr:UDP-N-acetylmuramate--L-alanine ligase [Actinomycetota bacterium]
MSQTPFEGRRLHFVGIGGVGMSGLALVTQALGAEVSGSDRSASTYVERLRRHGIDPAIGHDAANVPGGAEVVVSTAIPEDNPELAAARAAGARIRHRGELLGEVSRLRRSIAVAGTHGKTTTGAMLAHALTAAGHAPSYLIGGELRSARTNAAWSDDGDWIAVEADESDRSFLELRRDVAVVTNVELDHHASYRSLSELQAAFADFAAPAGVRILGPEVDLPGSGSAVAYGITTGDLRAEALELRPLGSRFVVEGTTVELNVPGRHNVLNALATLAACRATGLEPSVAAPALAGFKGTARRFEERGRTPGGARVFDDYAHHPTEVRVTLEAARTAGARRVVACFQPHLYSRTRELAREFGRALALADVVVVIDVYPARERAEDFPGVSGLLVAEAAAESAGGRRVWWLPSMDDAARMLHSELRAGDLVLTLGAGDVDKLAAKLTEAAPAGVST